MDELASDAKEANLLIKSMRATLRSAHAEITKVFAEMDESSDVASS